MLPGKVCLGSSGGGLHLKRAIVVGSGAGGPTVAKELQGSLAVTVLEAGKAFRPFPIDLALAEKARKTRLFFDEREIQLLFPAMRIRETADRMVLVNGVGLGGTTTLSAGNALRMDHDLLHIGINLDAEFAELYHEIPVTTDHRKRWRPATEQLFSVCRDMGLDPQPIPKMGEYDRCTNCGHCILGCPYGVKWDSRRFLDVAVNKGARLETGCKVEKVEVSIFTRVAVFNTFVMSKSPPQLARSGLRSRLRRKHVTDQASEREVGREQFHQMRAPYGVGHQWVGDNQHDSH